MQNALRYRDQIITAAASLFFRFGVGKINMDEVAQKAKVTKRTLYHHFETKEALLNQCIEAQALSDQKEMLANLSKIKSPRKQLQKYLEKAFSKANQHSKIEFKDLQDIDHTIFYRCFFPSLQKIIEEGIKKKEFKKTNPQMHALVIWSLIGSVMQMKMCHDINVNAFKKFLKHWIPETLKKKLAVFLFISILLPGSALFAATPQQIIEHVEANHPTFLSIQKQLDGLEARFREAESFYDTQLNFSTGVNTAKSQATSPFDLPETTSFTSRLGIKNNMTNGLQTEFFGELSQSHYVYPASLAGFGVPSDIGSSKLGINLLYPLFQNGGGILDQLRLWNVRQQVKLLELNLLQQKREKRYQIYNTYYQLQLISEVLKAHKNTLERNQEYLVIANRKRQTGFIEGTELVQAQLATLTSEKDLLDSTQQFNDALRDFKISLYFPPEYSLTIEPGQEKAFQPGSFENFEARVLQNDLNAQGLSLNILVTLKNSDAVQNTLQSNTSLQGSLAFTGKNSDIFRSFGDLASFQYPSLFIGIQSDLASATEKEKALAQQTEDSLALAQWDYQLYLSTLKGRIRKAYDQYLHYQKMQEIHLKIIDKNKQYISGLKVQYYQGRADRAEVTQAENMYQLAEIAIIQNEINLKLAETTLKYLTGEL